MAACNEDCFNCIYPDCIRTFSQYDMYRDAHKRYEQSEKGKENQRRKCRRRVENGKNAEYCRRYYQRHREEILRKRKEARGRESRKKPSEIVQEFIDFLEASKTEYEEAKAKCDKYDSIDRHIYWAHKFELASDKNERNRLATAYQKERLDRRACKNTVDRLKTIHDYVCSDNNKSTIKRMKGMIQVQKSQEDYLYNEKEYKGGDDK